MQLKPKEFYQLSLIEFADWSSYVIEYKNQEEAREMQRLAWQTSLLMNSTGNYKKTIQPTDLYKNPYDKKEEKEKEVKKIDPKQKEKELADLKKKFGIT